MKKVKCLVTILLILFIICICNKVQANSINSISMDIYVEKDGTAIVTETWECTTNQGTEVYHPYYNLGNSEIRMISVNDNGKEYNMGLGNWDTDGTLSTKAYKYGINHVSNGVELCWGMNSYGRHIYVVKYEITNFVTELNDSQMIYWTLIPHSFSDTIGKAYVKVYSDFDYKSNYDVWGYGDYGGTCYVYDGYIEMGSNGTISSSEYMTILAKFPFGTFNTTNKISKNFSYFLDMAEEGSTKYNEPGKTFEDYLEYIIPAFFIIVALFSAKSAGKAALDNSLNFGQEGKKIPKDVAYFRDIPCNNDVTKAYYIASQYGLVKNKTDVLGAFILKWLKDSIIRVESKEKTGIFKKEDTVIIFNNETADIMENQYEKELYEMLYKASEDGILEAKEFERYCKKFYSKVLSWFDKVLEDGKKKLISEGLLIKEEYHKFFIGKYNQYNVTNYFREEAMHLAGLKRFLEDYTLINDRQAIEVALFENYLIFAQIFGIAKKVAKEFKDLYPDIIEDSNFTSYDYVNFVTICSNSGISQANAAQARASNYSGGGGGFSSGGGGGGSFGGGGGRRRFPLIIIMEEIKYIVRACLGEHPKNL